jgi:hypothetical protein
MGNNFKNLNQDSYQQLDEIRGVLAREHDSFFSKLLLLFSERLKETELRAYCWKELVRLYDFGIEIEWCHGRSPFENEKQLRQIVTSIVLPTSEGPLLDCLHNKQATFESEADIQKLLAAYHQELGRDGLYYLDEQTAQQLRRGLTPQGIARLICETIKEIANSACPEHFKGQDQALIRALCSKKLPFQVEDLVLIVQTLASLPDDLDLTLRVFRKLESLLEQPAVIERCYTSIEEIQRIGNEIVINHHYGSSYRKIEHVGDDAAARHHFQL